MKLQAKIFSDLLFRKVFLMVLLLVFLQANLYSQDYMSTISTAMKQGDTRTIAVYFDNTIDLTFSDHTNTYSKKQALVIIQNFFNKIEPRDYIPQQRGKSQSNNTKFNIGSLYTSNGIYKVYMLFIVKKGLYFLKELRFEK